ncbi:hypothetical protein PROFUN_12394 [Planoprotostelium fungivorum]|uniref:F-box domain-containing protein n=1 Tax=Planoprotostelium fungivorum TaxID=1890364 RepID=A0A2P6N7I0_9EUKA|nr:hypothetical protein PROFUN_12394 [Planoprotostelium fungivorum]
MLGLALTMSGNLFESLPKPIQDYVLSFLLEKELCHLAQVSRGLRQRVHKTDRYWMYRINREHSMVRLTPNELSQEIEEAERKTEDEKIILWERNHVWRPLQNNIDQRRGAHRSLDIKCYLFLLLCLLLFSSFVACVHYNLRAMSNTVSHLSQENRGDLEDLMSLGSSSISDFTIDQMWMADLSSRFQQSILPRSIISALWFTLLTTILSYNYLEFRSGRFLRHIKLLSCDFALNIERSSIEPIILVTRGTRELRDVNLYVAKGLLLYLLFSLDYLLPIGGSDRSFIFSSNIFLLLGRSMLHAVCAELVSNLVVRWFAFCKSERSNLRGLESVYSSFFVSWIIHIHPFSEFLLLDTRLIIFVYLSIYYSTILVITAGHPLRVNVRTPAGVRRCISLSHRIEVIDLYLRGTLLCCILFLSIMIHHLIVYQFSPVDVLIRYHWILCPMWMWIVWSVVIATIYFFRTPWRSPSSDAFIQSGHQPNRLSLRFPYYMILW